MGPTDRFFAHLQNFFLLKIIVKSAIFRVNFFPKKMQAIFKHFSGYFGKKKNIKKNYPTERPLFGICSPVEQGFFSWPYLFLFILFFCISIFGMPTKLQ